MESLQTFEGKDLASVLAEVHAELGTHAEIVSATRSRVGGIGGFFSREVFRVQATVNVAAVTTTATVASNASRAASGSMMQSLLAMADERSAAERTARPVTPVYQSIFDRAHSIESNGVNIDLTGTDNEPALDLTDRRGRGNGAGRNGRDGSDDRELRDSTGTGGGTGIARRELALAPVAPSINPSSQPQRPSLPPQPATAPPVKARQSLVPRRPIPSPPVAEPPPPDVSHGTMTMVHSRGGLRPARVRSAMEILERIEPRRATRTVTSLLGGPLKELVDLGVPAAFAELGELSVRALANRLEGLPAAPSLPATGIVAVVGPLHRARQLATHLGADATVASREMPRDLAAWLWIPNGAEAVNRRSRWTYRDRPMVVAVEGTPANSVKPFALDMVRSLAPAQIRVIVEAAWSVDVMAQWIKELTPLKVPVIIDVVGVDSAAQPAAVLQLGLPVATVDGMPAQPDWWASLLVERAGEER